jgi:hypothetical protein
MHTLMALALVLRVFDRSSDSAAERQQAMQTADAILRQADVIATWVDCSNGARQASHTICTHPLGRGELAVRVTPAPAEKDPKGKQTKPSSTLQRSLGYSMVEPEIGGTLATVFTDRIAWLAALSRAKYTDLLGRAVAHEIGHLLIGTNEHSASGLMRAIWTAAELTRNDRDDWLFTTDDRARLHRSRMAPDQIRIAETSVGADPDES